MPSNLYLCKYCHQRKPTETALNRHIAHSATCFQSRQEDLLRLTSSNNGVEGSIDHRFLAMDDSMPQDFMPVVDDSNVDVEMSIPDKMIPGPKKLPVPSFSDSEESDSVVNDACSQSRYKKMYPGGYAVKILGLGKTKYERWQEDQNLHGNNEWAPFRNQKEWELVQWLIKNVGQKSIDEYLKLPIASICT